MSINNIMVVDPDGKEYVTKLPEVATNEEYASGLSETKIPSVKQVTDDLYITGNLESDTFIEEVYVVPTLTANGTMYVDEFAVSASSEYSTAYAAWKATNGSTATSDAWITGNNTLPYYFNVGFDITKKVTEFSITNRTISTSTNSRGSMKTFTLQGSKTNVVGEEEWIDIQSYTNGNNDSGSTWNKTVSEANQDYYYGYRFKVDEVNETSTDGNAAIGEINFTTYTKVTKIKVKDLSLRNYEDIKGLSSNVIEIDVTTVNSWNNQANIKF